MTAKATRADPAKGFWRDQITFVKSLVIRPKTSIFSMQRSIPSLQRNVRIVHPLGRASSWFQSIREWPWYG